MRLAVLASTWLVVCSCGTPTPSPRALPEPDQVGTPDAALEDSVDAGTATAPEPTEAAPSQALARARKLVADGKLHQAHIALHALADSGGTDAQAAELELVGVLYRLKLYGGALSHLQRIIRRPDPASHHATAIAWLVKIGRFLPEASDLVPKRVNLNQPGLRPVRDELLLLQARRALDAGKFSSALRAARRVTKGSPHYEPARLAQWEALWRTRKLTEAGKVLRSGFLKGSPHEARAHLELARMMWRQKDIARAGRHFNRAIAGARKDSRVYAAAVFERSLMRLHQRGRLSQLNGMSHKALRRLVVATACALGPGADVFAPYRRGRPTIGAMQALLAKHRDNARLFMKARTGLIPGQPAKPGQKPIWPPTASVLMQLSLRDEATSSAMAHAMELRVELGRVAVADKAWQASEAASHVLQELTVHLSLARNEAGKLIRQSIRQAVRSAVQLRNAVGRRGGRIAVSDRPGRGFHVPATVCPKLPKAKNPPPSGGGR